MVKLKYQQKLKPETAKNIKSLARKLARLYSKSSINNILGVYRMATTKSYDQMTECERENVRGRVAVGNAIVSVVDTLKELTERPNADPLTASMVKELIQRLKGCGAIHNSI